MNADLCGSGSTALNVLLAKCALRIRSFAYQLNIIDQLIIKTIFQILKVESALMFTSSNNYRTVCSVPVHYKWNATDT